MSGAAFREWVTAFVDRLAREEPGPGVFNPWRDRCSLDLREDAPERRRERLLRHWLTEDPRILLIGEAPGYQGCRYTGIPFTSERLLREGRIPGFADYAGERLTRRERPWSEPSATIVWGVLEELDLSGRVVMHNLYPWHPHPVDRDLGNRSPDNAEREIGGIWLRSFLDGYLKWRPEIQVVAVGRLAHEALGRRGIRAARVRHPARGGARAFRIGLAKTACVSV